MITDINILEKTITELKDKHNINIYQFIDKRGNFFFYIDYINELKQNARISIPFKINVLPYNSTLIAINKAITKAKKLITS